MGAVPDILSGQDVGMGQPQFRQEIFYSIPLLGLEGGAVMELLPGRGGCCNRAPA